MATARLPQGPEAPPAAPRRVQGEVRREQAVPRWDQASVPAAASLGTTVSVPASPQCQEPKLNFPG